MANLQNSEMPAKTGTAAKAGMAAVKTLEAEKLIVQKTQPSTTIKDSYTFKVPGTMKTAAGKAPVSPKYSMSDTAGISKSEQSFELQTVERVVFGVKYDEGDATVTVRSPTGRVYAEGDPEYLIQRYEWGQLIGVLDGTPGTWTVNVGNLGTECPTRST